MTGAARRKFTMGTARIRWMLGVAASPPADYAFNGCVQRAVATRADASQLRAAVWPMERIWNRVFDSAGMQVGGATSGPYTFSRSL